VETDDSGAAPAHTLEALVEGIDHGIESHLAWNQRLLRCALLHETPGDDMLNTHAHLRCQFGIWFSNHRHELDTFDEVLVEHVAHAHRSMRDAVRRMCNHKEQGRAAEAADLQAYEQGQSTMVTQLNELRGRVIEAETHRDMLTGLPLRHGLEYAFGLRRKDARREGAQLWLAMIDVDHFKSVNDNHGHAVGDAALQHIARCLAACLRQTDAMFRFGGEEFLGLFLVHELHGVELLAARLVQTVSAAPLTIASGVTLHLTVTVGLAHVGAAEGLARATERADHAMLLGKARGRGRFVVAPD
jgi:diguanylate cyclase (GGDEF)-like protein